MYVDGWGDLAGAFPFCVDPSKPSLPFLNVPLGDVRWETLVPFETTRDVPLDGPGPSLTSASIFVRRRFLVGRRDSEGPGVEELAEPSASVLDSPAMSSSSSESSRRLRPSVCRRCRVREGRGAAGEAVADEGSSFDVEVTFSEVSVGWVVVGAEGTVLEEDTGLCGVAGWSEVTGVYS